MDPEEGEEEWNEEEEEKGEKWKEEEEEGVEWEEKVEEEATSFPSNHCNSNESSSFY